MRAAKWLGAVLKATSSKWPALCERSWRKGIRMDSINIVSSYADKLSALETEVDSLSFEELKEYWLAHEARARIPGVGSKNCRDVVKLFKIVKG